MRKDVSSALDARLRDEIDDQVAEAFDAYLAERLTEPGPLRSAHSARRRVVLATVTLAIGAMVTLLMPAGVAVGCALWLAIAGSPRRVSHSETLPLHLHLNLHPED